MKVIYFFIKLFSKQKQQVFFLSRQYSKLSYNYKEIIKQLKKNYSDINIKVVCKKINADLNESLRDNSNKNSFNVIKKINKEIKDAWTYCISLHTQMLYIAQSKVVIVDGYNIPVSVLKHKKNTKVIQMWHALAAVKKFGYQSIGYKDGVNPKMAKIMKMHANYDYVISGSKEMVPIFAEAFNTPKEKVLNIGTPYIDYLLKDGKMQKRKIYQKYPILKKKINILYSPTFRRDGRDNIEEVIKNIDSKKYNLIITYHDRDIKKKSQSENVLNCKDIPYKDLIKVADYVITDYSALSVEAAIVGTKVLFYLYDYDRYREENGININLIEDFSNIASTNIRDLVKIIDNNEYDEKCFDSFRKKYASDIKGNCTQRLVELIVQNVYNEPIKEEKNIIERVKIEK